MQYALNAATAMAPPQVFRPSAASLAQMRWPVTSLLDRPESTPAREFPRTRPRPLFHYAWRCVDDLATGSGWEAEYGRDARRLRKLRLDRNAVLRFDRIPQQTQSCNPPKRLS